MSSSAVLSTSGPPASVSGGTGSPPPDTSGRREVPRDGPPCAGGDALHTCFYFTVFFSNNPPIFHSNRIPSDLLGITLSSATTAATAACVGAAAADGDQNTSAASADGNGSPTTGPSPPPDPACAACQQQRWQTIFTGPFAMNAAAAAATADRRNGANNYRSNNDKSRSGCDGGAAAARMDAPLIGDFRTEAAAVDEVPQQTLQTVAFPTAFGSCGGSGGGGGACPLPVRRLSTRAPRRQSSQATTSRSVPPFSSPSFTTTTTVNAAGNADANTSFSASVATPAPSSSSTPHHLPQKTESSFVQASRDVQEALDESRPHDSGAAVTTTSSDCEAARISGTATNAITITTPTTTSSAVYNGTIQNDTNNDKTNKNSSHHAIACLAPSTLPLTVSESPVTVTPTTSTTTANITATALESSNFAPSAVSARFQPTFPMTKWEEEEEDDDNDAVEKKGARPAAPAANDKKKNTHNKDNKEVSGDADGKRGKGETEVPAAVPAEEGRVALRTRRPRRKVSAATTTPTTAAATTSPSSTILNGSAVKGQVTTSLTRSLLDATPARPPPLTASAKTPASAAAPSALAPTTTLPVTVASVKQTPIASAHAAASPTATAAAPATTPMPADTTTITVLPVPVTQEGPPWNMRIEEVRSAKGELRYYRFILAVSFAALITSHTGMLHSMQTRNAATALVLTCPPSGVHFRFFLHHVDVLRSVLNRTTEFAIRTVQRFFGLLFSPTQKPKGTQQQVLKGIMNKLETHSEACETYRCVKAELASALGLLFPLPLLAPESAGWVVPVLVQSSLASARTSHAGHGRGGRSTAEAMINSGGGRTRARRSSTAMSWLTARGFGSPSAAAARDALPRSPPPLSEFLYEATAFLCEYSEGFASAFVCGLLSLAAEGGGMRGLRTHKKLVGSSSTSTATAAAAATATAAAKAHSTNGAANASASRAGSPTTTSTAGPGTRDVSVTHPTLMGLSAATTPDWLSAYASYFSDVSVPSGQSGLDRGEGERAVEGDGWVRLSRPSNTPQIGEPPQSHTRAQKSCNDNEYDDDDDDCLRTRVSASTVSSTTPVLSPLTVDVEARNPAARLPRDRTLSALSPVPATSTSNSVTSNIATPAAAAATTTATTSAPAGGRDDEYALHRGRLGRVVIFTQDAALARRLLLVAAFLWNDCGHRVGGDGGGGVSRGQPPSRTRPQDGKSTYHDNSSNCSFHCVEAQRMYETAVAAAVSSAEFANVPIQWVREEFSEARLNLLCSRFSPENTLLIVVPRQLQCRRVSLRKHVAGTTVLVEQQAGREARIRSPAFPFCCSITKQVMLLPDATVTTLLREACSLHKGSHGTVNFAEVFPRMVQWLYWQSAAAVLRKRDVQLHAALKATLATAANASDVATEQGGVQANMGSRSLSCNDSVDLLWPSRSASALASRSTTPTSVTPVAFLNNFPRAHASAVAAAAVSAASLSIVSASPCSLAMQLEQSLAADSAEEVLLPGSRGGASAAWAYTPPSTNTNQNAGAHTSHTRGGELYMVNEGEGSNNSGSNSAGGVPTPPSHPANTATTSTLLVSHGLLQPPSAFVSVSPTAPTPPQRNSSLRFLNWFKSSSPATASAEPHCHPVLSPAALGQLSVGEGGQLPRLLSEDDDAMHV